MTPKPDSKGMLEHRGPGYDYNLYSVTLRNKQTVTMTGHCLRHCYLNSIDDSVESYELKEALKCE